MPNPVNFISEEVAYEPITVSGKCVFCDLVVSVSMPWKAFMQWRLGKFIQDVAPNLTGNEREFLMTRICGKCFDDRYDVEG